MYLGKKEHKLHLHFMPFGSSSKKCFNTILILPAMKSTSTEVVVEIGSALVCSWRSGGAVSPPVGPGQNPCRDWG